MAFHNDRLPTAIEVGATIGPVWNTTIARAANGAERRNQPWAQSKIRGNLASGVRTRADIAALRAHFNARAGRTHSFPFKDWSDFEAARQTIGTTDGSTATFQIVKAYTSGAVTFSRRITKPVSGTVSVWVNAVSIANGVGAGQYQINLLTGVITLGATLAATTGQAVEVQCEFNVPVRYDVDSMEVELRTLQSQRWGNIVVVEVDE